ncbi:hypothetical protein Leryth_001595 [Lithospermum erythrorhizon]|nr:hypothetical protein Leryth_001595 [Lithospermum erythrorhizon]
MVSSTNHKLAVINFSKEKLELESSWAATRDEVVEAMEEYGCFVALYDNVSSQLHEEIFESLKQLFDLPTSTKVLNKSVKPLFGYVGGIPLVPLYESLGIDNPNTLEGIQNFTKVMWPEGNDSFRETLLTYAKSQVELEQMVMQMIFEKYGVEKYLESYKKVFSYLTRVQKYRSPKENESNLAFVSHTDKSFMSIVHQHQYNGLEIRAKDGEWFNVDLTPSSFVAWSNNKITSAHHRVIMEEKGPRFSIAQFSFVEGIVETPEEFIDEEHPLQYKSFDHIEFLRFYAKPENLKQKHELPLKVYCGV